MDLESALKRFSKKIWNELEPVGGSNINIHEIREEGLTSMGLKELVKTNCPNIHRIDMIGGTLENKRGYDFELCIGSSAKKKFVRYFIQAKRLYGNKLNSSYRAHDASQSKSLEDYATSNKGVPLYTLYNHLSVPSSNLELYFNAIGEFKREFFGATVATVGKLKQSLKFGDIHQSSNPHYYRWPFLRYHPNDMQYYEDRLQAGVPLHELSRFTIDRIEELNNKHRDNQKKNIAPFFFFFFFDGELAGDSDELFPIIEASPDELYDDFLQRVNRDEVHSIEQFNPRAIIILEEENNNEQHNNKH